MANTEKAKTPKKETPRFPFIVSAEATTIWTQYVGDKEVTQTDTIKTKYLVFASNAGRAEAFVHKKLDSELESELARQETKVEIHTVARLDATFLGTDHESA